MRSLAPKLSWGSIRLVVSSALAMIAGFAPRVRGAEEYTLPPESQVREGVPRGRLTEHTFDQSQVFPGTTRTYWLYVPAQYTPETPACLMVFQDGAAYVDPNGPSRVPIVLDNMIAAGELPVIVGLFIEPGVMPREEPDRPPRRNRSVEYDTLNSDYARFLVDEMLPVVAREAAISDDPERRAIYGASSGGICAFTVAWERPDAFRKVISEIGSFTNIRGGHVYPALIRKTERKPLRVLLQDGRNDLDNPHGHWPLANEEMAAALRFAAYDYKFVYGDGAHDRRHGGAILPDSLRWIWRDVPRSAAAR